MIVLAIVSDNHRWAKIAFFVDFGLLIVAVIFIILFAAHSKRETRTERYDLDYFKALGDGYAYSYKDSEGSEHGGFVSGDSIEIGLSAEVVSPFLEVKMEYGPKKFWFIYSDLAPKTIGEKFYFSSAGSVEIP